MSLNRTSWRQRGRVQYGTTFMVLLRLIHEEGFPRLVRHDSPYGRDVQRTCWATARRMVADIALREKRQVLQLVPSPRGPFASSWPSSVGFYTEKWRVWTVIVSSSHPCSTLPSSSFTPRWYVPFAVSLARIHADYPRRGLASFNDGACLACDAGSCGCTR